MDIRVEKEENHMINTFLNISSRPEGILHHLRKAYTACTECKVDIIL